MPFVPVEVLWPSKLVVVVALALAEVVWSLLLYISLVKLLRSLPLYLVLAEVPTTLLVQLAPAEVLALQVVLAGPVLVTLLEWLAPPDLFPVPLGLTEVSLAGQLLIFGFLIEVKILRGFPMN